MEDEVWDTPNGGGGKVIIHLPNGESFTHEGELSAKELQSIVRATGTRKFTVKYVNGETVPMEEFPISGCEVFVEEYNEAK